MKELTDACLPGHLTMEGMMRPICDGRLWSLLICAIVVMVLQGCTTPLVDVKVSTCDQETKSEEGQGKGACNVYPAFGNYTGPAYGFLKTTDNQMYTGNGNCSGGKKCAGNPGTCASGKPCVSWVYNPPADMRCKCDCAP